MSDTKRDSYRSRIFAAQQTVILPATDYATIIKLRDKILKSAWWKKNRAAFPMVPPRCGDYDDIPGLHYGYGSNLLALLHAMAHHCVQRDPEISYHGPEFAKAFLLIVKRFMGQEVRDSLAVAMAEHKVKTRSWSPAARQAAKERHAAKDLATLLEELG